MIRNRYAAGKIGDRRLRVNFTRSLANPEGLVGARSGQLGGLLAVSYSWRKRALPNVASTGALESELA